MARLGLLFIALALLVAPTPLFAHRDDYINETFVFQTLSRGEFEPEYSLDFHKAKPGNESFFQNSLAFEYGITNHWMIDGIASLKTTRNGETSFERTRVETRQRFAEEGDWPIDFATSLEYELEKEGGERESFISPRLVLAKDIIPKLNTTLNLFAQLKASGSFKARSGYALGIRYPAETFLRYGIEIQGTNPDPNELIAIPQIWFAFPHDATLKLGGGASLIGTNERFFIRGVFEVEL